MDTPTRIPLLAIALFGSLLAAVLAQHARAGTGDARSGSHRLISGSAASVNGTAASPSYQAHLVGGSGAAVGIAASQNTSIVAGNATIDPPVRLFLGNFENE
jgi:hypothetical protein